MNKRITRGVVLGLLLVASPLAGAHPMLNGPCSGTAIQRFSAEGFWTWWLRCSGNECGMEGNEGCVKHTDSSGYTFCGCAENANHPACCHTVIFNEGGSISLPATDGGCPACPSDGFCDLSTGFRREAWCNPASPQH